MTMPDTTVTTNLNKAFDVKVNFFSEVTFNPVFSVNNLTEAINLLFGKVIDLGIRVNTSLA